ncbi:hypothetical protein M758_5G076400 [Ceratodon purpureus]|nr:hypothetical protein M758_5G076400 [Ceratodon purpureus]
MSISASCLRDPHREVLELLECVERSRKVPNFDPPFYSIVENTQIVINSGTKLKLALATFFSATCLHFLEISN